VTDYDTRETHRFEGQPVECYKFTQGDNAWLYTSADEEVILPTVGTFEPQIISRGELDFSHEDTGEQIDLRVPRANAVAALFIGNLPSTPIGITIHRAHRGDEDIPVVIFSGKVIRARFEESEAILVGSSLLSVLNRTVPTLAMQTPCNHVLFSQGCGVNPTWARDSVTLDTVVGATITSTDFTTRADGWFNAGRIETTEGETRFIVNHVGNTVTLMSACPGLRAGDTIWAYWGCDHLEATCASKFSNRVAHLGWSRLPGRNPFGGRID
jgi:uncharacterized phage protein (TIGR02218 family)